MQTKSFTLIELLVVIVIIGILAGVITLSVSSNIAKAQDTKISASILSLNKILKTESILSFPIEATPCNLKDSCTNLKSKIDIPKIEDDIYYVTSTSGDFFSLSAQKKSDTSLGFKITSDTESVFEAVFDTRDNNSYKVVKIGNQTWMAENLKYLTGVYAEADGSTSGPRQYVYGYNGTDVNVAKATTNYQTYGVLYNYPSAITACPAGWHLPSHDEWTDLERAVCTSGTCLTDFPKDTTTTGWRGTDEGTKLKSGGSSDFEALMAGYRDAASFFNLLSSRAYFWSSTPSSTSGWIRNLYSGSAGVNRFASSKASGLSVRCIRDY